jgi:hypothetical protein
MDWNEIKTRWQAHRASVARHWQCLSERELDQIAGERERLSQRIQEVYRVSAAEADRQICDWEEERVSWDPSSADGPAPTQPGEVAAHSEGKAFRPAAERLVATGTWPEQPAQRAGKPTSAGEPAHEPGVSEDDAVPAAAGNPQLSEQLCHTGYLDEEDQCETNESTRLGADSSNQSGRNRRGAAS